MTEISVQTGFGYYKDQVGNIIAKAELPAGQHNLADGMTYVELNSMAELDAIEVYQDPAQVQAAQQQQKIAEKLRSIAINELIKDGNWP